MINEQQWEVWFRTNALRILDGDGEFGIKKRKKIPVPVDPTQLPPVEPPPASHALENVVRNVAEITLPEDNILISGYEGLMQDADATYFGALSPTQLAHLLQHDGLPFHSPDSVRVATGHTEEIEDILKTIIKESPEIHRPGTPTEIRESRYLIPLPDDEEQVPIGPVHPVPQIPCPDVFPGTPIKRVDLPMPDVETPRTKKRRWDEMIHGSLETLISSEASLPRRRNRYPKLLIDVEKKLSDDVYSSQQDNITFQTMPKRPISIPFPSALQLLGTPSMRPAWGKPLAILYEMMILKPMDETSIRDRGVPDVVRRPHSPGTSRELSDDPLYQTRTSERAVQKINGTEILQPISHDEGTELPVLVEDKPELIPSIHRPELENGRPRSSRSASAQTSLDRSITSTIRAWVKADVLGTLELLWSQQQLVRFIDLCPTSLYNRLDAARAFVLLLGECIAVGYMAMKLGFLTR